MAYVYFYGSTLGSRDLFQGSFVGLGAVPDAMFKDLLTATETDGLASARNPTTRGATCHSACLANSLSDSAEPTAKVSMRCMFSVVELVEQRLAKPVAMPDRGILIHSRLSTIQIQKTAAGSWHLPQDYGLLLVWSDRRLPFLLIGASKAALRSRSQGAPVGEWLKCARQSGSSDGLWDFVIGSSERRSCPGSNSSSAAILVTPDPTGLACLSCGLITALDTECATCRREPSASSFWLAETRSHDRTVFRLLFSWQTTCPRKGQEHHHQHIRCCRLSPRTAGDGRLPRNAYCASRWRCGVHR